MVDKRERDEHKGGPDEGNRNEQAPRKQIPIEILPSPGGVVIPRTSKPLPEERVFTFTQEGFESDSNSQGSRDGRRAVSEWINRPRIKADLQPLVMALTEVLSRDAGIELPGVTRLSKEKLSQINENIRGRKLLPVSARELELFTRGVLFGVAQIVGPEQIARAGNEILSDPSTRRALNEIADAAPQYADIANQVTNKIAADGDSRQSALGLVVLCSALLLAAGAGVIVPLLSVSVTAEVILTNEVAIAAVAVGAAALIERK